MKRVLASVTFIYVHIIQVGSEFLPTITTMEKPLRGRKAELWSWKTGCIKPLCPCSQKSSLLHTMCFPDQQVHPRNERQSYLYTLPPPSPLLPNKRGCSMPAVEWLKTGNTSDFQTLNQSPRLRSGLVTPTLLEKIQQNQRPKMWSFLPPSHSLVL